MPSLSTSVASNYIKINSSDGATQLVLNGISIRVYGMLVTNNQIAGTHLIDFFERDGVTPIFHLTFRNTVTFDISKYFDALNGLTVAFSALDGDFTSCTIFYSTLV